MKTITDESIEQALNFLRDSAKPMADWKSRMKFLEQKRKTKKATAFLESEGANIAERESRAYTEADYLQCLEDYKEAVYEYEVLENQRRAAELRVEVWRTLAANQRRGNI